MELQLDCIPCFQRQALQAARFVTDDEEIHQMVLKETMKALIAADWEKAPPQLSKIAYQIVKDITQVDDPYKKVKYKNNQQILKMYSELQQRIAEGSDPLLTACKLAIAGNIIDYGALSSFNVEETIETVLQRPLQINHYKRLKKHLDTGKNLAYITDNAGEIVFDKLLIEQILAMYPDIQEIVVLVKGGPSINDAMVEDAKQIGLPELPRIVIKTVGVGDPTSDDLERWDPEFLKLLDNYDLVISKGQGNYEALSSLVNSNVFFLLMAKCTIVARDLGVPQKSTVLKSFPTRKIKR